MKIGILRIVCVLLPLLCIPKMAFAEVRLAILEFQGIGVDKSALHFLSDRVRSGVLEVSKDIRIDGEELIIMTRENMMAVLEDQGKTAADCVGECEVELAKNIGADYVISGEVGKVGSLYVLTIKIHETARANLLGSENVEARQIESLLSKAQEAGEDIFVDALGARMQNRSSTQNSNFQDGFLKGETDNWSVSDAGKKAIVSFDSNPSGAVVLIDGAILCAATPCSKKVTAGSRKVSVQKERYKPWVKRMTLKQGKKIDVDLEPTFGYLSIDSGVQKVSLFLDGKRIGETPIRRLEVDAGVHKISVQDPCYTGKEYEFKSVAGKEKRIEDYPIQARPAGLDVSVQDENGNDRIADVFADGKYIGESPGRYNIPLCSQTVSVRYDGVKQSKKVELRERKVKKIVFTNEEFKAKKEKLRGQSAGAFFNPKHSYVSWGSVSYGLDDTLLGSFGEIQLQYFTPLLPGFRLSLVDVYGSSDSFERSGSFLSVGAGYLLNLKFLAIVPFYQYRWLSYDSGSEDYRVGMLNHPHLLGVDVFPLVMDSYKKKEGRTGFGINLRGGVSFANPSQPSFFVGGSLLITCVSWSDEADECLGILEALAN
ncbi:MAG: PEGA domain-containing protein [Myxococcota bacterium]|nr:PEGA domain-containing protein [Myxococcota bacterium]